MKKKRNNKSRNSEKNKNKKNKNQIKIRKPQKKKKNKNKSKETNMNKEETKKINKKKRRRKIKIRTLRWRRRRKKKKKRRDQVAKEQRVVLVGFVALLVAFDEKVPWLRATSAGSLHKLSGHVQRSTCRKRALVLSSHRHICHLCDTPFCNMSPIIVRYPMKTSTKELCETIATNIARYDKYRCWASKEGERYPENLLRPFVRNDLKRLKQKNKP